MILKIIVEVLTAILAVMYTVNIRVLNNHAKAVKMHAEIPPSTGLPLVNTKVIISFLTGIGFVAAFIGLLLSNPLLLYVGACGALLFFLFYIVEVVLWGRSFPKVWLGFFTFGLVTALIGLYHFLLARGL